jgi:two-component system sensor histidine kinase EvgS
MQTLQRLTQADEEVMRRMLDELSRNLQTETQALHTAVDTVDWLRLREAIHRLKGIACLIDATPLARAVAEVDACCESRSGEQLARHASDLYREIARLAAAIARC